jgi:hypothetical protein
MLVPLLGYFLCMITVLAAAAGAMIGLFDTSTSDRAHHYPRPVVERNITTATNREPRLFMAVPETKDGSPAKDVETNSAVVPTEKTDAKKSKLLKPKMVARQRNNFEGRGYGNAQGYAQETQYGPQRLFSNW